MSYLSIFPVPNKDNSVPVPMYGTDQPNAIFLKPSGGNDQDDGLSPDSAVKTFSQAQSLITADRNATVYVLSEDNSASGTTDYQSSTLTLSKDGVRYVGVNSGGIYGQRSRIAQTSTATAVSPLVTFSGNNCYMSGIHVFQGVNDADSKVAVSVTGDRNHFYRCHFAGIGNDTQDVAGAASLSVQGEENLFEECVIGLDTVGRGTAANSEIRFDGGPATRNVFRRCIIPTFADANTHQFIVTTATGMDRFQIFEDCLFYNAVDSAATNMTEAFDLASPTSPAGGIILKNCMLVGATEWDAGDTGNLWIVGPVGDADISGIAVEPAV